MKKLKQERLQDNYEAVVRFIDREYTASPQAYLADFYERKAKLETSSVQWSILITFAINLLWNSFAYTVLYPIMGSTNPSGQPMIFKATIALSLIVLIASVVFVSLYYWGKKGERAGIMLEEHILKRRGIIRI